MPSGGDGQAARAGIDGTQVGDLRVVDVHGACCAGGGSHCAGELVASRGHVNVTTRGGQRRGSSHLHGPGRVHPRRRLHDVPRGGCLQIALLQVDVGVICLGDVSTRLQGQPALEGKHAGIEVDVFRRIQRQRGSGKPANICCNRDVAVLEAAAAGRNDDARICKRIGEGRDIDDRVVACSGETGARGIRSG